MDKRQHRKRLLKNSLLYMWLFLWQMGVIIVKVSYTSCYKACYGIMKGKSERIRRNEGMMKRQIIAIVIAAAMIAGGVPAGMKWQESFTAEAAKKVPSIKKIYNSIVQAYGENYVADYSLTTEEINERYGLSSKWYKAAVSDIPLISARIDTLVIVRAKNAKTKKKIKKKLQEYQRVQIEDTLQYPMNLLKAQASKVYTKGDYVCFFMLGFISNELEETGTEEEQIKGFEEQNQIAVDAVNALF